MNLYELGELVDRAIAEGHGADTVEIPCQTGGFMTPSDVEVDEDNGYVYIQ